MYKVRRAQCPSDSRNETLESSDCLEPPVSPEGPLPQRVVRKNNPGWRGVMHFRSPGTLAGRVEKGVAWAPTPDPTAKVLHCALPEGPRARKATDPPELCLRPRTVNVLRVAAVLAQGDVLAGRLLVHSIPHAAAERVDANLQVQHLTTCLADRVETEHKIPSTAFQRLEKVDTLLGLAPLDSTNSIFEPPVKD